MNFLLRVWRQKDRRSKGKLVEYEARDISPHTSFLEMLDIVNENLLGRSEEPIAFDSDCREGICGTCALTINGQAHGPDHPGAACELYMRKFRDGTTIIVEPFRVRSFPVIKDLVIDRSALDRIVQAGGFISARAGSAPEANSIPIPKHDLDLAMEAAGRIGCGACAPRSQSVSRTQVQMSRSSSFRTRFARRSIFTFGRSAANTVEPEPDINAAATSFRCNSHILIRARKTNFSNTGRSRSLWSF